MSRTLEVTAHAKLNLTLRVVGRRANGLHLLDGITAFTRFGDRIRVVTRDGPDTVCLGGPFAERVVGENIVVTALARYRAATQLPTGIGIEIEKNIPVAAGLGGGSCDAGAVLRVLQEVATAPLTSGALDKLALSLGADVPACLACRNVRMRGIGEHLEEVGPLPPHGVLLVNPGVPLTAGSVFQRFHGPYSSASPELQMGITEDRLRAFIGKAAHNDLLEPAVSLAPVVSDVLDALSAMAGAVCVGMSGSGATCFALFDGRQPAQLDAGVGKARSLGWWAIGTELLR